MLYIFHGNDIKKVLNASQKLIEGLKTKREFAQVFYFYPENFNKENLETQQSAQGLFFDKHIFVFKNFIESPKVIRDYVLDRLEDFIISNHLYIILENDIDDKYLDKIKKIKDINIKDYKTKNVLKEDNSGKLFNLAALIMKINKSTQDKVSIISQIDELKKNGTAPEEFFGILWWRYKKYASRDKESMKKLLDIYHDGHGGEEEMWTGLERWIIK